MLWRHPQLSAQEQHARCIPRHVLYRQQHFIAPSPCQHRIKEQAMIMPPASKSFSWPASWLVAVWCCGSAGSSWWMGHWQHCSTASSVHAAWSIVLCIPGRGHEFNRPDSSRSPLESGLLRRLHTAADTHLCSSQCRLQGRNLVLLARQGLPAGLLIHPISNNARQQQYLVNTGPIGCVGCMAACLAQQGQPPAAGSTERLCGPALSTGACDGPAGDLPGHFWMGSLAGDEARP